MDGAALIPMELAGCGVWKPHQWEVDGPGRRRRGRPAGHLQEETIADRAGATQWGPSVVRWAVRWLTRTSGGEWQGAQSGQGAVELGLPGPALGEMEGEAPRLAGDASGQGEEAPAEGLGSYQLLFQADACGPAGQVVGHDLDGQPGGVGGEASRGEMVEPHAVLEVADGVLDLGVAAMVGLQIQDIPLAVGDERRDSCSWRTVPVGSRAWASPGGR